MEKSTLIPHYIEAKTKKGLMQKMLLVNQRASAFHRFFDIQKDGNKYIAWYYKDVLNG